MDLIICFFAFIFWMYAYVCMPCRCTQEKALPRMLKLIHSNDLSVLVLVCVVAFSLVCTCVGLCKKWGGGG